MRPGLGFRAGSSAFALILVAGCSTGHHTASNPLRPTGTLVGTLAVYGCARITNSCGSRMRAGTVQLSDGGGAPFVVNVGESGRFSAQVPAGRYTVRAGTHGTSGWPIGSCRLLLIADKPGANPTRHRYLTLRQSQTTHVTIGCVAV
jgi:hypothetical protein